MTVHIELPAGATQGSLRPSEMAELRRAEAQLEDTGWSVISDRNRYGDRVILASHRRNFAIVWPHTSAYHDCLRTQFRAEAYARQNPED